MFAVHDCSIDLCSVIYYRYILSPMSYCGLVVSCHVEFWLVNHCCHPVRATNSQHTLLDNNPDSQRILPTFDTAEVRTRSSSAHLLRIPSHDATKF